MEFTNNKPIYLQISDSLCDRILSGELQTENRIPSVRELGLQLQVNPNTVMRTYEYMTSRGIIHNKRGLGYFVSADARDIVLAERRSNFFNEELPRLRNYLRLIGVDKQQLLDVL